MKRFTSYILISLLLFAGSGCSHSKSYIKNKSEEFVNQITKVMESSNYYITKFDLTSLFPQIEQSEANVFGKYNTNKKITISNKSNLQYSITLSTLEQFKKTRYEGYVTKVEYEIDNAEIVELVMSQLLEKSITNDKYELIMEGNRIQIVMKEDVQNNIISELTTQNDKAKKAVEERNSELARQKQEDLRNTIRVNSLNTTAPNSAGGVDFSIKWTNTSNKIIKYIIFTVEPYNAVNDVVTCEIRGTSTYNGKVTGPVEPGEGNEPGYHWENAWYNNTITNVKLKSVEIEYMDGSQKSIGYSDIEYIIY